MCLPYPNKDQAGNKKRVFTNLNKRLCFSYSC